MSYVRDILDSIERFYSRLIRSMFGYGGATDFLWYEVGPYAVIAALALVLCVVFTLFYRKWKHAFSHVAGVLTGVLAIGAAVFWRLYWVPKTYGGTMLILALVPVAFVVLIAIWMFVLLRKAAKTKAEAKDEARRLKAEEDAERWAEQLKQTQQRKAEQARLNEQRKAELNEKVDLLKQSVASGTSRLVSQAKEGASAIADTAKQIMADGSSPLAGGEKSYSPDTAPQITVPQHGADDRALEKIKGLHELLKLGYISQDEFESKKAELLKRI